MLNIHYNQTNCSISLNYFGKDWNMKKSKNDSDKETENKLLKKKKRRYRAVYKKRYRES